jgi:hypothetical protein
MIQYATLLRNTLDTNLTIHLEYSNEVWNSQFDQSQYCDSMGLTLGYSGPAWDRSWQYYAKRTADMFHIFDSVFAGNNRLKKVVASQAANPWLSNQILTYFEDPMYNPYTINADMLAIAPYFGGIADELGNAGLASTCTVSQILDSMQAQMPESLSWMTGTKTVADNHDLELVCYEGGQHLVAGYAYHNDTAFVNKLIAANRDSRMTDLYCDYFNFWYDSIGVNLFCHFSSHYQPGKYGSWGVKETYEDTLSPKYIGLQNCVFDFNSSNLGLAEKELRESEIVVYPNPTINGEITILHDLLNPLISFYDLTGRKLEADYVLSDGRVTIDFQDRKGMILVVVESELYNQTKRVVLK